MDEQNDIDFDDGEEREIRRARRALAVIADLEEIRTQVQKFLDHSLDEKLNRAFWNLIAEVDRCQEGLQDSLRQAGTWAGPKLRKFLQEEMAN